MIGIIGAMDVEIEALRSLMKDRQDVVISGVRYSEGTLRGIPCVVSVCGIGKVFAAICAQTMILTWKPDLLLNIGVAGSLSKGLSVGNIAIASCVVQHDMDTSVLGDPVGMISGINLIKLPADVDASAKLAEAAVACGIPVETGVIVSGDQFIGDRAKKEWLRSEFKAIACEMEGAAIGHVAYINGVPFAVLRAISDSYDTEAPQMDYETFKQMAAANSVRVLRLFLEQ